MLDTEHQNLATAVVTKDPSLAKSSMNAKTSSQKYDEK